MPLRPTWGWEGVFSRWPYGLDSEERGRGHESICPQAWSLAVAGEEERRG